jgi:putative spermidine/putrescine transport system substrate-binding protein
MRFLTLLGSLVFSVTAMAQKDVTLRILQYGGYTTKEMNDAFAASMKSKHQANVSFEVKDIENEEQLFNFTRQKLVDIITPGIDVIPDERFEFLKNGLVIPLDESIVTNLKSLDKVFQKPAYLSKEGKIFGTPFTNGAYFIFFDKDKVKAPPTSVSDFFSPAWAGRYSLGDYPPHQAYLVALASGISAKDVTDLDKVTKNKTFAANYTSLHKGAADTWNMVDSGKDYTSWDATISFGFGLLDGLKAGKKVGVVLPKEGVVQWVDHMMVTKAVEGDELKKKIAMEFVNYTLSKEYQTKVLLQAAGVGAVRKDAFSSLTADQRKNLNHYELLADYSGQRLFLPPLSKRTRNGYTELFKKHKPKGAK